jgi:hypothetical protein
MNQDCTSTLMCLKSGADCFDKVVDGLIHRHIRAHYAGHAAGAANLVVYYLVVLYMPQSFTRKAAMIATLICLFMREIVRSRFSSMNMNSYREWCFSHDPLVYSTHLLKLCLPRLYLT